MRRYIWQEIICEKRRKVLLVKRKLTSNVNFPFFDGKIRPLCTETAADSIDNGRFVPSDKYSKPVPIPTGLNYPFSETNFFAGENVSKLTIRVREVLWN